MVRQDNLPKQTPIPEMIGFNSTLLGRVTKLDSAHYYMKLRVSQNMPVGSIIHIIVVKPTGEYTRKEAVVVAPPSSNSRYPVVQLR
jgi:hypothetical protein